MFSGGVEGRSKSTYQLDVELFRKPMSGIAKLVMTQV